jgi:hypothetical protein
MRHASVPVWSDADPIILQAKDEKDEVKDRVGNAIEVAILPVGKAKRFIKSSSCQKVIEAIWSYVYLSWLVHETFIHTIL